MNVNNNNRQQAAGGQPPRPPLLGKDDPLRMALTPEEHQWAQDIKMVIESNREIDNLSDYMYTQLALISKEDVNDAEDRALQLQQFRQEYKILDTLEDGIRALRGIPDNCWPFLQFNYSPPDGTYVIVLRAPDMDALSSYPDRVQKFFAGTYYVRHACTPDMESIRKGLVEVMDCQHASFALNPFCKIIAQLWRELTAPYPFKTKARHFVNPGVIFNSLVSIIKRAMPKKHKDAIRHSHEDMLDFTSMFLVPTPEKAKARVLANMTYALQRRYQNEQSFQLGFNWRQWKDDLRVAAMDLLAQQEEDSDGDSSEDDDSSNTGQNEGEEEED